MNLVTWTHSLMGIIEFLLVSQITSLAIFIVFLQILYFCEGLTIRNLVRTLKIVIKTLLIQIMDFKKLNNFNLVKNSWKLLVIDSRKNCSKHGRCAPVVKKS
jgi:hypothetical protein